MKRGQAVVETALAMLVIVTVVLFGLHFAEVGYASIKTHEASAFAMWDATGRPIHALPGTTFGGYAGASAARAQARYADFDSRAGATGASFTQAVTRATGMQVSCSATGAVSGPPPPGVTGGVLPNTGGAACSASADLFAVRIPHQFAEGSSGFFNRGSPAQHVKRDAYVSCGMGRPKLGACKGQLGILLGDWALSLPGEEATAPGNPPFEASAERIWRNNGDKQGDDAEDFATKWAGYAPYHLPFEIKNDTEHTLTEVPGGSGSFLP
jgi:hypothetical protein